MDDSNVWLIATGVKRPTKCNASPTTVQARQLGASCTIDRYLSRRIPLSSIFTCTRSRVQMWVIRPKVTSHLSYQNLQNKFTLKHDFYY